MKMIAFPDESFRAVEKMRYLSNALSVVAVAGAEGAGTAFAAGAWRDAGVPLEQVCEVLRGAEAEAHGDLGDRGVRLREQFPCRVHAAGEQELAGRESGQHAEACDEVGGRHAGASREVIDADVVFGMGLDVAQQRFQVRLAGRHGVGIGGGEDFEEQFQKCRAQAQWAELVGGFVVQHVELLEKMLDAVGAAEKTVGEVQQRMAQGGGFAGGLLEESVVLRVEPQDQPIEDQSFGVFADGVVLAGEVDEHVARFDAVCAAVESERQRVARAVVDLQASGVPVLGHVGAGVAVVAVAQHRDGRQADGAEVEHAPLGGVHVVETQIRYPFHDVRNSTRIRL